MKKQTDWNKYYHEKKSWFSTHTQKYTMEMILKYFDEATVNNKCSVIELGGGNSCFAEYFCDKRSISQYDIIDNNDYAVELFQNMQIKTEKKRGHVMDLVCEQNGNAQYDFVYSIGLIEHFDLEERNRIIANHFAFCKPDGYVLISFPTPTRKYKFWRGFLELIHKWQFWDETPLMLADIQEELEKYGRIIRTDINKKLFLSQRLVLIQKRRTENV